MRDELEALLKEELRVLAILTRDRLGYKQKRMAEALVMSDSSYSDIETGEYMCGTLTAVLLLIAQPDPNQYLRHLEFKLRELYDRVGQPV
jgi:DNA-binding XRE family transcriptional regulator